MATRANTGVRSCAAVSRHSSPLNKSGRSRNQRKAMLLARPILSQDVARAIQMKGHQDSELIRQLKLSPV